MSKISEAHQVALLLGGIAVLLGTIFIAIGTIRRKMMRNWVTTTGQVINKRGDPLAGGLPARYPTFRWRDSSGVEHRHTSSVGASLGPRPGKLVPVKYDPRNPSRGVIDSSVQSGRIFTVIGIVIAVMGILGASYAFWIVSTLS